MKKICLTLLITLFLSTSYGYIHAAQINTSGGTWNYGVSSKYVWSNYYHGSKAHYSKVKGSYWSSSGYTSKGYWSKASATKAPGWQVWNVNKTYYGFY
ncbi:lactococcin 972 family bacteriocin [Mammaliicoccus lentus]|uniref:Lactococcin 972 family bacteriocin n=1 Tax=Mammaliicoccus lentus TaxID=42858 RepID=A0ABS6GWE5_MAMLE|nr:lactococcin 972 family bacteriocin [Mammaliicoccus lentus]MBU6112863.1 lactococcin 972 family bacteriocin [Mammaliicoccus lentus]